VISWQTGLMLLMGLLVVLGIAAHAWPVSARKVREDVIAERHRQIADRGYTNSWRRDKWT
jgi:hypothetical protein